METWGVVFLGVIALSVAVQAGFLVAMALAIIRLAQRIDALQDKLDEQVAPALAGIDRVTRNAAEISDLATVQARRIDLVLTDTIEKVEDTVAVAQRLVSRPMGPITKLAAVVRAVQTGLDVFRQLGQEDRVSSREGRRHGEDDEHLFI